MMVSPRKHSVLVFSHAQCRLTVLIAYLAQVLHAERFFATIIAQCCTRRGHPCQNVWVICCLGVHSNPGPFSKGPTSTKLEQTVKQTRVAVQNDDTNTFPW